MQLTQAHGSVLLQPPEPVKANYPGERGRGSAAGGAAAAELSQPITANVLFMSGYTWSANNKAILERVITKAECKMATAGRETAATREGRTRSPPRTRRVGWGHGGDEGCPPSQSCPQSCPQHPDQRLVCP